MKLQTSISTAVAALLLTTAAHAQTLVFQDTGTAAPTPGPLDISQLSTAGTGNDGQLNYYWDNGRQHTNTGSGNGFPGETFTTGGNAGGYWLTSFSLKTDGNGGDTPTQTEPFTISLYQISGTGGTNATLLTNYTVTGKLNAEGDWITVYFDNLHGTPLKLQPNTTYAYGFGIAVNGSAESWERLASATGVAGFAGQICVINVNGGTVTYSTNASPSVATFDLGLNNAAVAAVVPGPWTTNSVATFVTNEIQWNLWGPGLTYGGYATGANGFGEILPLFQGLGDALLGAPATIFTNELAGPSSGLGDEYADQFIGVFIPPVTTNYTFFICSDDYSQLYLSTDITATHLQLVAQEDSWSTVNQWTTSAGGSNLKSKRSDQFVPAGAAGPQYPNGIPLVAGWMYFIELNHENGTGGYNDAVTYSFAGAPDPVNGSATVAVNNGTTTQLGYVEQPPSYVTFTQNPANTTAYVGGEASFNVGIASDATPYAAQYQWQTNGVNVTNADGTAANTSRFTYVVSANDNNTKVQCVVTFPAANTNVYTSSQATLTVVPGVTLTGGLKREFFGNQGSLTAMSSGDIPAGADYTAAVTNGSGPQGTGINNYDERYSGWFTPPTTGNYVFFLSSDDNSELYISTDNTPDSKYLIAQETTWATNDEWLTDNGGGITTGTSVAAKRSDQFIPPGQASAPYSAGIALTAGKMYYIEADHNQGGGGDDFSMTFALLSQVSSITNGVPSAFGGANIALSIANTPTNLVISQNPLSATVFEGGTANFQVSVTTDSQLQPVYQWLLNGSNVGGGFFTNLTSTYSVGNAIIGETGDTLQVIVTIPFTSLAATSTVATLTVQKAVQVPGFLKFAFFPNETASSAIQTAFAGTIGNPALISTLNKFETPINDGVNNFIEVVSGYFIPPEDGMYVFNVASDDQSELFLSTDDTPGNLRLIAQVDQWDNSYQWTSSSGGSTVAQKESDTWSPDPNDTSPSMPWADGISLKAGSNYFIEEIAFQGGGGDNAGVAFWTKDGNYPLPADGSPPNFASTNIAMLAPPSTVTILTDPVSTTALSGTMATFTATGSSTSTISVNDQPTVFVVYQWYTNGVAVAGATTSKYTTGLLTSDLNNEQVVCAIGAIGAGFTNTTAATLTITKDTVPPTVVDTFSVYDNGGGTGGEAPAQYVDVIFSKAMDASTLLNPSFYTITGATITGVTLFTNGAGVGQTTMAILQLAAPLSGNFSLTLNGGIQDISGVGLSGLTVSGTADNLSTEDIGIIAIPGITYKLGSGSYEVDASGIDIWGTQDSFRFTYEQKTNNFDVEVQVPYLAPADTWTKAGLMVRETIDPLDGGSRMMFAIATASTTLSPLPLDGSGAQNAYSTGIRASTDGSAFSGTAANQYYFVGDGVIPVPYPNVWVRMTRTGVGTTNDTFTGYSSTNGSDWTMFCSYEPQNTTNNSGDPTPFPATVFVGMCETAHLGSTASPQYYGTAVFQNFGDYVPGVVATRPVLTAAADAGKTTLTISWTPGGGSLYQASTLSTNSSGWTLVGTNNPATVPIGAGSAYFEVIQ